VIPLQSQDKSAQSCAAPKTNSAATAALSSAGNVRLLLPPQTVASNGAPPSDLVAAFIELQAEARAAGSLDTLKFVIVNATRKMALFDQAFLLEPQSDSGWRITLASSVAKVDHNAPMVRTIEAWASRPRTIADPNSHGVHTVELPTLDGQKLGLADLKFGLWVPIKSRSGDIAAILLVLKQESWRPQHVMLMAPLAGAYGHAWEALAPAKSSHLKSVWHTLTAKRVSLVSMLVLAAGAFVPVPLTALAPAEIVAATPSIVTAPIDGVVRDILVPPGTFVAAGTPLIQFVDTKLRNDFEIAGKAKSVAEARYFKAIQSALTTQKELEDIAIAQGELAVAGAELAAAEDLLSRSEVKADKSGLAIYSSASDWIGKPVQVGERIMEIGDPSNVELRVDLPVSDAVALKQGNAVSLFLDGDPLRAIDGIVTRAGYRPIQSSDQQLIYRVYASFQDRKARRIGLRGTARVSGDDVSVWYYLLRRPLSALRQRIGF
jgi:multidrug efflux pump subunit AcrA (membrane-fusion protein)